MRNNDKEIEIETYKGQTIFYDTDDDKFKCEISIEDKSKTTKRQSLKDVRSMIDTFAKENLDFKPFKILIAEGYSNRDFAVYHVEALRLDGKFVVKREDRLKWSGSFYGKKEMANAMLYDPEIIAERKKLQKVFEDQSSQFYKQIENLAKKMTPMDLSKYDDILK